jgi:hypothetical protein
MALIKLSAGNDDYWLLNDIPHQRGEFDISATIGQDVVELYNLTTLKSLARGNYNQFTPDGITPYGSTQLLVDDLKTFFFATAGSGGGGGGGVQSVTGDGVGGTATDPVLSFPNADDVSDTSTINKFVTDAQKAKLNRIGNVNTQATATVLTPAIDTVEIENITSLASDLTINAPTATLTDGLKLIVRILDNGTSRNLTWDSFYREIGVTLPAATTIDKLLYVGCIYNADNNTFDVVAVKTQV